MNQSIILGAVAGLASAFLFGVLTPGMMLFAPFMFVAAAPLIIVGIGWHPLIAALGALIACILISFGISSKLAISFAVLTGLPAYLVAVGVLSLMRSMPAGTPPLTAGRVFGTYVLSGIALYSALAMLIGAMAVDTNYSGFEAQLTRAFERLAHDFGKDGPDALSDPAAIARMGKVFVSIFVPLSAIVVALSLTTSLWIAIKFLVRVERLPFVSLPAYNVSLPKETLIWLVGGLLLAQGGGFIGLFGAAVVGTFLFVTMLNGLALVHFKTLGKGGRAVTLWLVWGTLMLFAPALFVYSFAGLLDSLFDFRRAGGSTKPSI